MYTAIDSPFLVPFDGGFKVDAVDTRPPKNAPDKKECKKLLEALNEEMQDLQEMLYAFDHHSVLLVFQAMDAAGKDSTIRAVLSGVNPAGCQVFSFKQPSKEELDHDFLWRTAKCLPERGRIGVFNRSYYEEVLVVRVHPEYLDAQRIPARPALDDLWQNRFKAIRDHEEHLARSGTVILKFWLNVSKGEQRARFLDRIDTPRKNWKFAAGDVAEREHWTQYMEAYEDALAATSRPWAPWFAVPADDKPFMRMAVAKIIVDSLKSLKLRFPDPSPEFSETLKKSRKRLDD